MTLKERNIIKIAKGNQGKIKGRAKDKPKGKRSATKTRALVKIRPPLTAWQQSKKES